MMVMTAKVNLKRAAGACQDVVRVGRILNENDGATFDETIAILCRKKVGGIVEYDRAILFGVEYGW